jgi:hypothetical protein
MGYLWWIVPLGVFVAAMSVVLAWSQWRHRRAIVGLREAKRLFHLRREWLEADFYTMASRSGKPRGLIWQDCDFENEAAFATDRQTGQLRAFVALTIRFAAAPGSPLEDNPNLANLRAATAVFVFDGRQWITEGRAIFNLNPLEAIQHFQHELQGVD